MQAKTFVCSHCGKRRKVENRYTFDGRHLCPDCLEELTVQCIHCGERLYRDSNAGNEDTPLCSRCFERFEYEICERCGVLLRSGDAYYEDGDDTPYCYTCFERYRDTGIIHNYSYKPDPIFYGEGPRYFGIELEIDDGGERNDHAEAILSAGNCNGNTHIYAKRDGSLNDGFEVVSAPMSYCYHCNEMPWAQVLEEARSLRYRSHGAGTCGLHVHVARLAFGDDEAQQEACIARILYFFEKHWEELLKFSRRTPRQLERWAARYGYKEQPMEILNHAKKGTHAGRYTCVNLENENTIEFRMFRGTLKLNTFIATLQMVNHICDVAISLSDDELKALSWSTFASGITEDNCPELVQYLKERRLYVNDVVELEEVEV